MRLAPCVLSVCLFASASCREAAAPAPSPQPPPPSPVLLEPFEGDEGRHGYRDTSGRVVIAPRYAFASEYSPEGLAWVLDDQGPAWIDRTGRLVARPFVFDNGPDPFVEGRARYVEDGRMGFIDPTGRVAIPARFEFVNPFSGGRASFCEGCRREQEGEHAVWRGGRWGEIDPAGTIVVPPAEKPSSP